MPAGAGVIPGAYRWAVPIRNCPLDHMLNPAELKPSPARFVREYSFLTNPRLPAAFRASAAHVRLDLHAAGGRAAERARLHSGTVAAARVLNITNLAAIADELWDEARAVRATGGGRAAPTTSSLLSRGEWRAFRGEFARLQGGWCCAPHGQKPGAAGFHILHV